MCVCVGGWVCSRKERARHAPLDRRHSRLQAAAVSLFRWRAAEPFVASLAQIHARPGVEEVIGQACYFGTFIAKAEVVLV